MTAFSSIFYFLWKIRYPLRYVWNENFRKALADVDFGEHSKEFQKILNPSSENANFWINKEDWVSFIYMVLDPKVGLLHRQKRVAFFRAVVVFIIHVWIPYYQFLKGIDEKYENTFSQFESDNFKWFCHFFWHFSYTDA